MAKGRKWLRNTCFLATVQKNKLINVTLRPMFKKVKSGQIALKLRDRASFFLWPSLMVFLCQWKKNVFCWPCSLLWTVGINLIYKPFNFFCKYFTNNILKNFIMIIISVTYWFSTAWTFPWRVIVTIFGYTLWKNYLIIKILKKLEE